MGFFSNSSPSSLRCALHNGWTDLFGNQFVFFGSYKDALHYFLITYQRCCSGRLDTRPGCSWVHVVEEPVNFPQRNTTSSVTHLRWERIMQYDQVLYTPKEGHTVLQFNCSLQSLAFQNEYHAIQVASVNNSFTAGLNTTHLTGRILI